jgi:tetratricopeptide (TPR) repeat protein
MNLLYRVLIVIILIILLLGGIFYLSFYNWSKLALLNFQKVDLLANFPSAKLVTVQDYYKLMNQASDSFNKNDFTKANELLDIQLKSKNQDITFLILKAQTLAQEAALTFNFSLCEQAILYVDKALDIDASSVDALTTKGYIFEIQNNLSEAHKYYDLALVSNPKFFPALNQKGHTYLLQGDIKNAEKYYKEALTIKPEYEKALLNLGNLYLTTLQDTQAKKLFLKVVETSQNVRVKSEAYYSLGLISEYARDYEQAQANFTSAIQTDGTSPLPYVGLARVQFVQGEVRSSFENLKKALEINPNQSAAAFQLALQFMSADDKVSAKNILDKLPEAIGKDPTLSDKQKEYYELAVKGLVLKLNE